MAHTAATTLESYDAMRPAYVGCERFGREIELIFKKILIDILENY